MAACALAKFLFFTSVFSAVKGEPQLIGSPEPVVGLVGEDVILPCSLRLAESVLEKTVEWTRSDLNPSYVHIFREGRLLFDEQNAFFQQRTSLFQQELKNGNMSLKLRRLQLSDKGTYKCKVVPAESETSIQVQLVVGAVSEPEISPESTEDTKLVLKCDAKNWYPKPEMEWRDGEGRSIDPHDYNHTQHDGLYSVYSRITVEMTANDSYTCAVQQQDTRQSREKNYSIPYVYKEVVSLKKSKSAVIGLLAVFGMVILALLLSIPMYICVSKASPGERFQQAETTGMDEIDGLKLQQLQSEIRNLQEQVSCLQERMQRLEMEISPVEEEAEKCRRENQE